MNKMNISEMEQIQGGNSASYWMCTAYFGAMAAGIGMGIGGPLGFFVGLGIGIGSNAICNMIC